MRFQSGFAARAERVAMETRAIERPAGVQQVLTPAGWSDVRVDPITVSRCRRFTYVVGAVGF